jgi:hypothetical protein|tara:strand:- start:1306 stop:1740 length:435 start_codon:yes stop_codon:yes gene_type:complete
MLSLLLALGISSSALSAEGEFADYKVGDITHTLPKQATDDYILGIRDIGRALQQCQSKRRTLTNPLIMRQSLLSVSQSRNGCRFVYLREANWQYECTLPAKVATELGLSMERASLRSGQALGDFSDGEKEVLFDSRFCRESSMK